MGDEGSSGEAQSKGVNFRSFASSLAKLRGEDALKRALDAAPGEVREAMRTGQIIASGWYPITWYCALHAAAQRTLGADVELARSIARQATQDDFNSLFRVVLKVLSPETAFGQAHRLVTLYYQGGTAERLDARPGVGRVRFSGWRGFDRNVWEDLAASSMTIVELCGAKNVRKYTRAGGQDGSTDLELELRWET